MSDTLIYILLGILAYGIGCFSTARVLAKSYRSLNIYKVGTGHPDTQNIFLNVDKSLGAFSGLVDFSKIYIYIFILRVLINTLPQTQHIVNVSEAPLLGLGFMMLVGHCLPVTHHFQGGRGIFTYMGMVMFFAPIPMLITGLLAMVITLKFKQYRFVQFLIVLLPPFLNLIFEPDRNFVSWLFVLAILMGIINFFVSKRRGEI